MAAELLKVICKEKGHREFSNNPQVPTWENRRREWSCEQGSQIHQKEEEFGNEVRDST